MDAYGTGLSDSLSTTVSDCAFNSRGVKLNKVGIRMKIGI